jgi:hypothetical protein
MEISIMAVGCSGTVQVTFNSIPGTYTVHLDGQSLQRIISSTPGSATANFTITATPGETITGYVEPLGVATCRVEYSYTLPECDIEVTSICTPEVPCDCTTCKDEETVVITRGWDTLEEEENLTATLAGHLVRMEVVETQQVVIGTGSATVLIPPVLGLTSIGVIVSVSPLVGSAGCNYQGTYTATLTPCSCISCPDTLEVFGAHNPFAPVGFEDFTFSVASPPGLTLEITNEGDVTTGVSPVAVRVPTGADPQLFLVSVANGPCLYEGTMSIAIEGTATEDIDLSCPCQTTQSFTMDVDCPCEADVPASQNIVVTGNCGTLTVLKTSGPGTVSGLSITGVDDTTEFSVFGSNGCGENTLVAGDVTQANPCDGETTTCSFFTDFGTTIASDTTEDLSITSFIVDGEEFLTAAVPLGPPRLVIIGGYTYNTSFSDAVNASLNPFVYATYPTGAQILASHALGTSAEERNSLVRITYPTCSEFSITITGAVGSYTLSDTGFTGIVFGVYGINTPFACEEGTAC